MNFLHAIDKYDEFYEGSYLVFCEVRREYFCEILLRKAIGLQNVSRLREAVHSALIYFLFINHFKVPR